MSFPNPQRPAFEVFRSAEPVTILRVEGPVFTGSGKRVWNVIDSNGNSYSCWHQGLAESFQPGTQHYLTLRRRGRFLDIITPQQAQQPVYPGNYNQAPQPGFQPAPAPVAASVPPPEPKTSSLAIRTKALESASKFVADHKRPFSEASTIAQGLEGLIREAGADAECRLTAIRCAVQAVATTEAMVEDLVEVIARMERYLKEGA